MKATIKELADNYLTTRSDKDFKFLYERLVPGVKNHIYKYVKSYYSGGYDLINDLCSITFYKVFAKIDTYNPKWAFTTWVYSIAGYEALNEIKRLKKHVYLGNVFNEDDDNGLMDITQLDLKNKDEYVFDMFSESNDLYNDETLYDEVIQAISDLGDKHRDILFDREVNRLTYQEIATKYELNLNTAKSRIRQARLKIRSKFDNVLMERE